jgi:mannose-6-phosphate isomerase-like protein (cupin superfamily)
MVRTDPTKAVHVEPAGGRTVRMPGAQLVTSKVSSEQTGGAYSLFEVEVGPGGCTPPHVQHREDECFYVLEGSFAFHIEGARSEAGVGSLIYVPKGTLHAFENAGQTTGRLLMSQTPGGLHERFIEEVGQPAIDKVAPPAEETRDLERLTAIGVEYGVEIVASAP